MLSTFKLTPSLVPTSGTTIEDRSHLWPFKRPPRRAQADAFSKAYQQRGFAHFLRMRLGKTGLALAEFETYRRQGGCDWMIVVVPNSLKDQWGTVPKEDWAYDIPVFEYNPQKRKLLNDFHKYNGGGLVIINYDSLVSLWGKYTLDPFLKSGAMICFDESTMIKEFSVNRSKAAIQMCEEGGPKFVRVLTGKPQANSHEDLYVQLRVIGAHKDMSHAGFKATFTESSDWGRGADKNTDYLKELMDPHVFIAGDEYLGDVPQKTYMPLIKVKMDGEQHERYKQMEAEFLAELADGTTCEAQIALTKYLRLRQASSGFMVDGLSNTVKLVEDKKNPRASALIEMLNLNLQNNAIVVCTFIPSINLLYERIQKETKFRVAKFAGGMKREEIASIKRSFNTGELDIIVAQESVLNFGHTLPGAAHKPCDIMAFYESSFSLINRAQCECRPEDLDRKTNLAVYDFFTSKMDKYMLSRLREKEDGASALMGYSRSLGIFGEVQYDFSRAKEEVDESKIVDIDDALDLLADEEEEDDNSEQTAIL